MIRLGLHCQMPPTWQLLLYYTLRTSTGCPQGAQEPKPVVPAPIHTASAPTCMTLRCLPSGFVYLSIVHPRVLCSESSTGSSTHHYARHFTRVSGLELRSSSLHSNHSSHWAIIPSSPWRFKRNSSKSHSLLSQFSFLEYLTQTHFK